MTTISTVTSMLKAAQGIMLTPLVFFDTDILILNIKKPVLRVVLVKQVLTTMAPLTYLLTVMAFGRSSLSNLRSLKTAEESN